MRFHPRGDSVGRLAKTWFNYKSQKIESHNNQDARIELMHWYPTFIAIANVLFLLSLIGLFLFNGYGNSKLSVLAKITCLLVANWVCNTGFSVFVSPITLRYQLFPVLSSFVLAVVLCNAIYDLAVQEEFNKKA